MSTAFNIFIRQSIRQGGIPFEITTQIDPFNSESNMRTLIESIKKTDQSKFVSKPSEEFKKMEQWKEILQK